MEHRSKLPTTVFVAAVAAVADVSLDTRLWVFSFRESLVPRVLLMVLSLENFGFFSIFRKMLQYVTIYRVSKKNAGHLKGYCFLSI